MQQNKINSNEEYESCVNKLEALSKEIDDNYDYDSEIFSDFNELHDIVVDYENEHGIYIQR